MTYDVIIVGAGPAGISTALFLVQARPELREGVLILERRSFPREKFCAGAVGARGDRILGRAGVHVDVPSIPISAIRVTVPGRWSECARGSIGRVIRRLQFDAAMAESARERGILLKEGTRVRDIRVLDDAVEVRTEDDVLRTKSLVGADGVGSVVRRSLGLPFGRFRAQAVEVDTPFVSDDVGKDTLHFDLSDRSFPGYAWDFPTPLGGEVMVSRGIYALDMTGVRSTDVKETLRGRLQRLGLDLEDYRIKRMAERGFDPHQPFSSRRVLLVGEAAGVDPLTGEGIAEAIGYGALAGPYLARKLSEGDLGFADWRGRFFRSPLGVDLLIRRGAASFCFKYARRLAESMLVGMPGALTLATGLFAGRFPYRSEGGVLSRTSP